MPLGLRVEKTLVHLRRNGGITLALGKLAVLEVYSLFRTVCGAALLTCDSVFRGKHFTDDSLFDATKAITPWCIKL
jgi:hypothetical protein